MSLKDAIREAVDERDKQEGSREKNSNTETRGDTPVSAGLTPDKHESTQAKQRSSKAVTDTQNEEETNAGEKADLAALTIRVARQSRIHWLVSAKQQNTTLTAAITEALNARFGEAGS